MASQRKTISVSSLKAKANYILAVGGNRDGYETIKSILMDASTYSGWSCYQSAEQLESTLKSYSNYHPSEVEDAIERFTTIKNEVDAEFSDKNSTDYHYTLVNRMDDVNLVRLF